MLQCKHPALETDGLLNVNGIHINTSNVDFLKTKHAVIADRLAQKVALYVCLVALPAKDVYVQQSHAAKRLLL